MIVLRAGAATDVGRVRHSNQDSMWVGDGLFVVADGVGGHRGGEVASITAVETARAAFRERTLSGLVEAVQSANRAVREKAEGEATLTGMGTTFTAVALIEEEGEERLALVNVGDSRAYLFQQGELSQLTEDHSFVEEMVREGRLTREEADFHPQRSLITRALGLDTAVEVDSWQLLPFAGHRILLCTDGLTNELSDDRIASVLRRIDDPQQAAQELVATAKAAGGSDNITVIVVDVEEDDRRAERASQALAADAPGNADHADQTSHHSGGLQPLELQEREEEPAGAFGGAGRSHHEPGELLVARPRRLTWRVVVFLLVLTAVLATAAAAIGWYARRTYFVALDGGQVAIFRGRPGGLLWFRPTLKERTDLRVGDVPPARLDDLKSGKPAATLAEARRYVRNLREERKAIALAPAGPPAGAAPPPTTSPRPTTASPR